MSRTNSGDTPAAHDGAAAGLPDRAHILTEQRNPRAADLHTLTTEQCVALINQEDRAVIEAVDAARPALSRFVEALEPRFVRGGRLIYVGAGTSGRLGVLDASECPPTFQLEPGRIVGIIAGGDSALRLSSEGKEDDPRGAIPALEELRLSADDTLLGIAAGGTTPYVHGAIAHVKQAAGMLTGLLTCSPVAMPAGCDHLIVLATGAEVLTGSTRMKAGSATKMALNIISTTLMIRTGRVYQNLMVDVRASNLKLRDRAARIISSVAGLDRDAALTLLDHAGGSVKVALVMHARCVDSTRANELLKQSHGRVDGLIER
jgi:N-acetylmuramic acid 6-phosphate etherase